MNRLTPNFWALSSFTQTLAAGSAVLETRVLDFNLARRSALIINSIIGQMFLLTTVTVGHGVAQQLVQELDVDPDNTNLDFAGSLVPEGVILNSSRPFRQVIHTERDTATGATAPFNPILQKDWTSEPELKRPISITPMRHHVGVVSDIVGVMYCELHIDYFIVELTLEELGIINASRR